MATSDLVSKTGSRAAPQPHNLPINCIAALCHVQSIGHLLDEYVEKVSLIVMVYHQVMGGVGGAIFLVSFV